MYNKLLSLLRWLRMRFLTTLLSIFLKLVSGPTQITDSEMSRSNGEQYYLAVEGDEDINHDMGIDSSPHWYGYLQSRSARDMENFRKKYLEASEFSEHVNIDDNERPNVEFYRNKIHSKPDGVLITEFHNSWIKQYEQLEYVHSYIQWLFPIQEHGMNYLAYPLSHKEIQIFREDKGLQDNLLQSYKLMLDFYGIELVEPQNSQQPEEPQKKQELEEPQEKQELQQAQEQHPSPAGEVRRANNWKERFENLNWNTHNNLRITRILKCLALLGLEKYQAPLVKFFLQETLVNKTLPRVKQSVLDYFLFSVVEEQERNELIKFAFQHFEPKEDFIWCPKNSKIYRKSNPDNDNVSIKTPNIGDLETNHDDPKGSSSAAEFGINTTGGDQNAENQDRSQTTDTKKSLDDYGRGCRHTHDSNENDHKSDGCVHGNQAKDIDTDTKSKRDELDKNKKLYKNKNSGLQQTKVQKGGADVGDEKETSVDSCENPANDTKPDTNKHLPINDEFSKVSPLEKHTGSNLVSELEKHTGSNLQQAEDQNIGGKAGDENVATEAGKSEDSRADCAKPQNNKEPNSKTTSGSPCENPPEDPDNDMTTYLKETCNSQQAIDQNHGSIAVDEIMTTKPGTNQHSGDDCTKSEKNQEPSSKSPSGSPCENPTEDTDTNQPHENIKSQVN